MQDFNSELSWTVYSYELPLVTGKIRDGLIIQLGDRWGEVAPYAGRSRETLKEALDQLIALFTNGQVEDELLPSVQFGLESILSPLQSAITAPLYAFLSGTPDEVLRQAERASKEGYKIVKVKVSSFPIPVAQEVIRTLETQFRIRVDCNSAFSFDEAMDLFSPFEKDIFDYIEDPTFELARLPEFKYPFALDETVLDYHQLPLKTYPKLYGFILKPTILGGKKGCAPLIEFAKRHSLQVVFSPAFESGLGLYQILRLAREFNLETAPLGLDTYRYFKEDILFPAINFNTSQLTITAAPQINTRMLKEIAHGKCSLSHF